MSFELHPNLAKKEPLLELPLSIVLLENESHYPWLILVPKRETVSQLVHLSIEDQHQLLREINLAHSVIEELFHPGHINVAAIGNKTPQLHIHVIGRFHTDPAWPKTVWDHPVRLPYASEQKSALIQSLQKAFDTRLKQS